MGAIRFASLLACAAGAAGIAIASAAGIPGAPGLQEAQAMRDEYESLRPRLQANGFGRPLLVDSRERDGRLQGDVYAVLEHPFAEVRGALLEPRDWCELLTLPFNVKRCETDGRSRLSLFVARRADMPVEEAVRLDLRYAVLASADDHLALRLDSPQGPVGTRDYRLVLRAAPIDAGRTYIHFEYGYAYSTMSRLAMQAYLATSGADKVGFSHDGRDAQGRPRLVGGMRGVLERNAMRYFLAIEAHLEAASLPREARVRKRLEAWFDATERYPRQLREMSRDDYLALKRRDLGGSGIRSAGR